jgi:hypothetical protein
MANNHHNNRNYGYRGRGRKNQNVEERENKEVREKEEPRENKNGHNQQEARELYRERRERENNKENREPRNNRDNQTISTFTLGEKELEGKNAEFQYDKGWYSITDIIGEEKNVIYKSKNAQEAYTKWNVYIGRKKERSQRAEKTEN